MPQTIFDLGKKVKAKYPGQYDDLSDDEVGRRVKAKFPGAYDDFADAPAATTKPHTAADQLGVKNPIGRAGLDLVEGIGAGVMSTARGLSKLAHKAIPAIPEIPAEYAQAPESLAGKTGKFAEQAAEFFVPAGAISKGAKAVETATTGLRGAKLLKAGTRAVLEGAGAAGVTAAQTGDLEEAGRAGMGGTAISGGLQAAAPLVRKAVPLIKNKLDPVKQRALDWAQKQGVPLSAGQQTGNQMTQRLERGLENTFGASGRSQEFFQAQEKELEGAGRRLVNATQPGRTLNPYEAGEGVSKRVQGVIADAKAEADKAYDAVRAKYAANPKTVQTGTAPTGLVDASGAPITKTVTQTFELPIDISAAKARLKPIFDELGRTMPEAKRQASPGYQALREIMEGPSVMDAVTADRNLSAIKGIARAGNNQFLNSRSQGLAREAIAAVSNDFNAALQAADPDILPILTKAREAVRKQHTVAEILNALPDEPAQLYQRLTTAGDRTYNDLAFLNTVAPSEMRQVGRTFLDGLFDKATAEGGFGRAAGVMRDWQRIGPNTKKLLFGSPATVQDLDNFFLAAKQLTADANPSHTGKLISALGILGAGIDAMRTPGTLKDKAERFGMDAGAMAALSQLLSRLLLTPGGARLMTQAFRTPPESPAFRQAVNALYSMAGSEVPRFAKGGIVDRPTIALVGEEGPEAVVPLTAKHSTVPETADTLKLQLEQLQQGLRSVVMFPHGTPLLKKPPKMKSYTDEFKNTFIYDPAKTTQREIDEAIQSNTLTDLLGAAEGGMGAPDKSELPADAVAVVARDQKGTTVQATATDEPHIRKAKNQAAKVTPKGGKVSVESPRKEISHRLDSSPSRAPRWYERDRKRQWFHKD